MVDYQSFKLLSPLFDILQRLSVYASMVSSWNSSWECGRCANRRRAANAPAAPAAIAKTVAEAINALFIMLLLLPSDPGLSFKVLSHICIDPSISRCFPCFKSTRIVMNVNIVRIFTTGRDRKSVV